MRRLGSVQQKMACVFVPDVKEEQSRKRECQQFQVIATENVNPVAVEANVDCAHATEKLDGTCCYVSLYKGQPYLWARLDMKPNKQTEKRFRKYQHSHKTSQGWVPVEMDNKQYCWHSSVVDYLAGVALVLRPDSESEDLLEIAAVPLVDLVEQTLELIGTNVNGNPYGLGSKKQPVHALVLHGSICIRNPPPVDFQQLRDWFQESPEGCVEGIVWHCNDGTLVKVHRHHLGLRWPDGNTFFGGRPVVININRAVDEYNSSKDLFMLFSILNGRCFSQLQDIQFDS
ncbi:uncharacterized protein C12orf29 homolog isoform X2 [Lampris incognitus]|uniref:uncharacterized protein C12orf29 homolog isoform X2 n=1 Tax=Lampris incognitus TaxID=2546036 RepID=UPI0024B63598|nr:uncharacterized protein C12orf29 homolog isoform X2 [Lampris incognitus]